MPESDKSLDVFGIKPVSEAISTVTHATTAGAGAFLSRICLPAAEEFGLLLRDKVSAWRAHNAVVIATKAEAMFGALPKLGDRHAHPRIVGAIIENGSWVDEDRVQGMWAGLLASACTESGRSQENLIFVSLLAQLTTSQAKTLSFACSNAKKYKSETGLLLANEFSVEVEEIIAVSGTTDIHVLDLEVDHLRGLGVLDMQSSLSAHSGQPATLTPSAMGLQLYVRCEGYVGSPLEYFNL